MTLTFCFAAMASRPARPANTLALAGLVTLSWNPFFLFDVGCQLSFLAIAALIWLVPPAIHVVKELAERIRAALFGPRSPLDDVEAQSVPWWSKTPAPGWRLDLQGLARIGGRLAGRTCPWSQSDSISFLRSASS